MVGDKVGLWKAIKSLLTPMKYDKDEHNDDDAEY
jgi:hypothetical protein